MPRFPTIVWTVLVSLLYAILFIAIPFLILTVPGARQFISDALQVDPLSIEIGLTIFGILFIAFNVLKNFTKRGTILNLVAGLALFGVGLVFLYYLGTFNASGPHLGFLSLSESLGEFSLTGSFEYFGIALIWITVTCIRIVNHVLGFIDARRTSSNLTLPAPP